MKKLMVFILGLLLSVAFYRPAFSMGDMRMIQPDRLSNQTAPDFTLMKTDGTKSSLNEARAGKKAIIFFWATWCPHCREELANAAKRLQEFKTKNIQIILVDIAENKSPVVIYLKSKNIPYESFLDTEDEVSTQYGIVGVPTLFFVNENGVVKNIRHNLPAELESAF